MKTSGTIANHVLSSKPGALRPASMQSTFRPRQTLSLEHHHPNARASQLIAITKITLFTLKDLASSAPKLFRSPTLAVRPAITERHRQYLIIIRYLSLHVNAKKSRKLLTCDRLHRFQRIWAEIIITFFSRLGADLFSSVFRRLDFICTPTAKRIKSFRLPAFSAKTPAIPQIPLNSTSLIPRKPLIPPFSTSKLKVLPQPAASAEPEMTWYLASGPWYFLLRLAFRHCTAYFPRSRRFGAWAHAL